MVIRRVGVWSVAKIFGAMYAVMGLIAGLIFAAIAAVGIGAGMNDPEVAEMAPLMGAAFGVGGIIIMPIFYGVLGLVFGALSAVLYNVFAGIVGGVKLEIQQTV